MSNSSTMLKSLLGYLKGAKVSESDLPIVLFYYEWHHIKQTGYSPLCWGIKYFACDLPMLVPGWIVEAYRVSDVAWDPDVFSPRQMNILGNMACGETFSMNLMRQQWKELIEMVGEDIELNFLELAKTFGLSNKILNRLVDDYEFCVLNFPTDLRYDPK